MSLWSPSQSSSSLSQVPINGSTPCPVLRAEGAKIRGRATVFVVAGVDSRRSSHCQNEMHASCPHKVGGGARIFRRTTGSVALLCNCICHSACPVANRREVTDEVWAQECTCPGSDFLREIQKQVREETDLRKSQRQEVMRDMDFGHGKSAQQVQGEILAVYAVKGYEAPSDFSRISRFAAANTARRGTRTVRLLIEIVAGLRAARGWAERNIPEKDDPGNQKELGRMRRSTGALTALAIATAAGAYFTKGPIRLSLVVLSTLLGLLAAWVGLWAAAIGSVVRPPKS
jgi:hypothetical protein